MKRAAIVLMSAAFGLGLLVSPPVFASLIIQFDFVSEPASTQAGAYIDFKGSPTRSVTFPNAPNGYDFTITQSDTADLIGIKGNIDGTFTVGTIATLGALQTAPLNGTGTFSLTDPAGNVLSAALEWKEIYTYGFMGGLNPEPVANLTGWTYGGSYQAFLDIKNGQEQSGDLTFQFNPGKTLSQLMATGADTLTTYSGSFSSTPEPATLSFLALGGLGALLARRRR